MSDQTPRIPDRHASEIIIRPAGHKIPPMSEWGEPIETPRVPDGLYWHAKWGLLELDGGIVWILLHNRESLRHRLGQQNPNFNPPLPSDAVKLGDATIAEVREVEEERNDQERRALAAEASVEALKREIREVLDVGYRPEDALAEIASIVEGENR